MLADSIAMPSYNSVLTLWWIAKDIDRYVSGEDEHDAEQGESDRHCSGNRIPGRPGITLVKQAGLSPKF